MSCDTTLEHLDPHLAPVQTAQHLTDLLSAIRRVCEDIESGRRYPFVKGRDLLAALREVKRIAAQQRKERQGAVQDANDARQGRMFQGLSPQHEYTNSRTQVGARVNCRTPPSGISAEGMKSDLSKAED